MLSPALFMRSAVILGDDADLILMALTSYKVRNGLLTSGPDCCVVRSSISKPLRTLVFHHPSHRKGPRVFAAKHLFLSQYWHTCD